MEISNIHINQYINGELSGEALTTFEMHLKEDETLLKKIKLHQDIDQTLMDNYLDLDETAHQKEAARLKPIFDDLEETVHQKEAARLKPIFDDLGDQYFKPASKKPKRGRIISLFVALGVAAALLFFFMGPWNKIADPPQKISATLLADQYFEKYAAGDLRGNEAKDFGSPKFLLQKGSEQYLNNQLEDAVQNFRKVANSSSLTYENIANWYLALCYLKQDMPEKAKPILKQLHRSKDHADKAKTILKQLE